MIQSLEMQKRILKLIDNLSFSRKNGGKENREVTRGIGIERESRFFFG